ncbi:MAG TPA: sensor histidine kinase [Candidatus Micrarchaeaceae archaeon]|nr:sensor histidine kinase [Candidatus Baltobacterales bacterium]HVC77496.1 sensor histidine kinase [Candidatus Micrarchaeaceae archaeon]
MDLALVAAVIVLAESEIWLQTGSCVGPGFPLLCNFGQSLGPKPVEIAYTTVIAALLLGRRWHPFAVLSVICALSIAKALIWVGSPGLGYFLPVLFASYSVGRYHRGRHPWLVLIAAGLIVLITSVVHDLRVPGHVLDGSLATFYVVALGALPMGRALQTQDLRAELSETQAREAELKRDEAARLAVATERGRIARELHDVVAHGVSMIVVQAVGAQGVLHSSPDRAGAALEAIETTARQSLDEMRRLLAVLEPDADTKSLEPAPGIEGLRPLVDRVVAAGQPVELRIDGSSDRLSPGLELTLYRAVQEALTNVVKHARGAATVVSLRMNDDHIDLDVINARGEDGEVTTGGRGLLGMRERVVLYGGHLEAGPSQNGGFRVHAWIPVGPIP